MISSDSFSENMNRINSVINYRINDKTNDIINDN